MKNALGTNPSTYDRWRYVAFVVLVAAIAGVVGFLAGLRWNTSETSSLLGTEILSFGPNPVVHGQPFNQQPSGDSAIWVRLNRPAGKDFVLVLAGEQLATVLEGDLMTALVPARLFSDPGSLQLWVEGTKGRSKTVFFQVK